MPIGIGKQYVICAIDGSAKAHYFVHETNISASGGSEKEVAEIKQKALNWFKATERKGWRVADVALAEHMS